MCDIGSSITFSPHWTVGTILQGGCVHPCKIGSNILLHLLDIKSNTTWGCTHPAILGVISFFFPPWGLETISRGGVYPFVILTVIRFSPSFNIRNNITRGVYKLQYWEEQHPNLDIKNSITGGMYNPCDMGSNILSPLGYQEKYHRAGVQPLQYWV